MENLSGYNSDTSSSNTEGDSSSTPSASERKATSNDLNTKEDRVDETKMKQSAEDAALTNNDASNETKETLTKGLLMGIAGGVRRGPYEEEQEAKSNRKTSASSDPSIGSKRGRDGSSLRARKRPHSSRTQDSTIPAEMLRDAELDGVDLASIMEVGGREQLKTDDLHAAQADVRSTAMYRRNRKDLSKNPTLSRLHKQKHQITSVAASLTANQHKIEEKRKQTQRSRSSSWARYGW